MALGLGGGGWAAGLNQGMKELDQRAIDQHKLDIADSEMALRNRTANQAEERLGMEKERHGIAMEENRRDNEYVKISDIEKNFGKQNPSAFNYGVDHATRNGYIETDADGNQVIRKKYLRSTMDHLDTPVGVDEVSKRDIALYSDKLRNATTDEEKAFYEEKLNMAKAYNKGALKQMEIEMRSEDRQAALELRKAMIGGRGGSGEASREQRQEMFDTNRLDRSNDRWQREITAAEKQYQKDLDDPMKGPAVATKNWNESVKRAREYWQPKVSALEKKLGYGGSDTAAPQLGGAPTAPYTGPINNWGDIYKTVEGAQSSTEARGRLMKGGYSEKAANEIMRTLIDSKVLK